MGFLQVIVAFDLFHTHKGKNSDRQSIITIILDATVSIIRVDFLAVNDWVIDNVAYDYTVGCQWSQVPTLNSQPAVGCPTDHSKLLKYPLDGKSGSTKGSKKGSQSHLYLGVSLHF